MPESCIVLEGVAFIFPVLYSNTGVPPLLKVGSVRARSLSLTERGLLEVSGLSFGVEICKKPAAVGHRLRAVGGAGGSRGCLNRRFHDEHTKEARRNASRSAGRP